jgi:large subunit ribosomal protein L30
MVNLEIITMEKIKITQIKSTIDRSERQKVTVKALGLRKIGSVAEHNVTPQIQGMLNKVNHLIKVEKL